MATTTTTKARGAALQMFPAEDSTAPSLSGMEDLASTAEEMIDYTAQELQTMAVTLEMCFSNEEDTEAQEEEKKENEDTEPVATRDTSNTMFVKRRNPVQTPSSAQPETSEQGLEALWLEDNKNHGNKRAPSKWRLHSKDGKPPSIRVVDTSEAAADLDLPQANASMETESTLDSDAVAETTMEEEEEEPQEQDNDNVNNVANGGFVEVLDDDEEEEAKKKKQPKAVRFAGSLLRRLSIRKKKKDTDTDQAAFVMSSEDHDTDGALAPTQTPQGAVERFAPTAVVDHDQDFAESAPPATSTPRRRNKNKKDKNGVTPFVASITEYTPPASPIQHVVKDEKDEKEIDNAKDVDDQTAHWLEQTFSMGGDEVQQVASFDGIKKFATDLMPTKLISPNDANNRTVTRDELTELVPAPQQHQERDEDGNVIWVEQEKPSFIQAPSGVPPELLLQKSWDSLLEQETVDPSDMPGFLVAGGASVDPSVARSRSAVLGPNYDHDSSSDEEEDKPENGNATNATSGHEAKEETTDEPFTLTHTLPATPTRGDNENQQDEEEEDETESPVDSNGATPPRPNDDDKVDEGLELGEDEETCDVVIPVSTPNRRSRSTNTTGFTPKKFLSRVASFRPRGSRRSSLERKEEEAQPQVPTEPVEDAAVPETEEVEEEEIKEANAEDKEEAEEEEEEEVKEEANGNVLYFSLSM